MTSSRTITQKRKGIAGLFGKKETGRENFYPIGSRSDRTHGGRELSEKYPACTWIWQEYEDKRSSAGQEPEVPVGPPSAVRNGLSCNPAEFRHKRDEQLRFYNSGYVLPYGTKTGCGEKSHPLHPLPAFKIADLEHESGTQGLYVHDHAILKVHYWYLPQTYPQTVLDASDSRNK